MQLGEKNFPRRRFIDRQVLHRVDSHGSVTCRRATHSKKLFLRPALFYMIVFMNVIALSFFIFHGKLR